MPKTESTMMPLGTRAPAFSLPDTVSGRTLSLADVAGDRATLILFICNHCPFVKYIIDGIVALARDYENRGVGIAAINARACSHFCDHRRWRPFFCPARRKE